MPPPVVEEPETAIKPNRYCTSTSTSTTKQQSSSSTPKCTAASPKLEELKLAFSLLAREIQGPGGDEDGHQALPCPPAVGASSSIRGVRRGASQQSSAATTTAGTTAEPKDKLLVTNSAPTRSCLAPRAIEVPAPIGGEAVANSIDICRATNKNTRTNEQAVSRRNLERNSSPEGLKKRTKAACFAEGRNAAEAAARDAKQALKRLRVELEAEKKNRTAAESALKKLQQRTAEVVLERDKLASVVNSFGGRSMEELSAGSERLERRMREVEGALAASRQLASEKAREALEALEQAADLAEALKTERIARSAAENVRKNLTQDLRACLRGRATAEEEAATATAALKRSELQRESLRQRLEVLRTANKRLDKKVATTVTTPAFVRERAGGRGGDALRLATARARLRTLSACSLNGAGGFEKEPGEKAAIERAMDATLAEKRWQEKLRKVEARGEAYKAAARTAATSMQTAVKEKAELEEVNRILARKIAETSGGESIARSKGGRNFASVAPVVVARGGVDTSSVGAREESSVPRGGGGADATRHGRDRDCNAFSNTENVGMYADVDLGLSDSSRVAPLVDRSRERSEKDNTAAAVTAALLARSNPADLASLSGGSNPTIAGNSTGRQAKYFRSGETQGEAPPWTLTSCPTRSNSVDATERKSSSPRCHRWARPRSASEGYQSHGRGAPTDAFGQGGEAESDSYYSHGVPYNRLLSESRRLREEVLSTVRKGPWPDGGPLSCGAPATAPQPQAHPSDEEPYASSPGVDGVEKNSWVSETAVTSVPIEVLLRLCDRGVRGTRGEWVSARDGEEGAGSIANRDLEGGKSAGGSKPSEVLVSDKNCCHGAEPTLGLEQAAHGAVALPPGISAALAQQVQGAVSRGDKEYFLQIVGRCGSMARGGIAQLLSIGAPE